MNSTKAIVSTVRELASARRRELLGSGRLDLSGVLLAGILFALLLAVPAGPALAEGGAFTLHIDPIVFATQWTDVDTNSAKFEEYRDLSSGFLVPKIHITGEGADDRELDLVVKNVQRDDARATLRYGVAGRYGLFVDYNKIIHRFGNDGRMLWSRTGAGRYEIADPVQRSVQTAIENQFRINRAGINYLFLTGLIDPLMVTANRLDLAVERNRTHLALDLGGPRGLSWNFDVKRENRTGVRPYGGTFGFSNATEIPEPIDYGTTDITASGEWGGARGGFDFGVRSSRFENNIPTVVFDNPFRITDATDPSAYTGPGSGSIGGSSKGVADLPNDNRADSAFFTARGRFGANWWANGGVTYTKMKQDDRLLPYTLNSAINRAAGAPFDATSVANLPQATADRAVDVLTVNANAGTRFGDAFGLTFRYRLYDYADQSDRIAFPGYVRYHGVWEDIGRITVPVDYSRQDLGAEFAWDATDSTTVGLTFNRQSWDRERREVETTDEDVFKLYVDSRAGSKVTFRGSYERGDKSIGPYHTDAQEESFIHPEGINNQPGLRKFDEAARTYDQWSGQANFLASESWNFFVSLSSRKDDYDKSQFGLLSDEILTANVELSYTPGENASFYLFGTRSDRDVFQKARQSGGTLSVNPLDDWQAKFNEVNDTWGLGVNGKIGSKWTGDLSASWTQSDGAADLFSPPGGTPDRAVGFDNYEDIELLALSGKIEYAISEHASFGLGYRYEDYTIDSFILQGLKNYLPAALILNGDNGNYTASIVAANLKLAF